MAYADLPPCQQAELDQELAGAKALARMYAESLRRNRIRRGDERAAADLVANLMATDYNRVGLAMLLVSALSVLADMEDQRHGGI